MIQIKNEYNNGECDVIEIYSDDHLLFDTKNGEMWDATIDVPISIPKGRLKNFKEIERTNDDDTNANDANESSGEQSFSDAHLKS